MKKILTTLFCIALLVVSAAQSQAALLTDWTYSLTSVSLENKNTDFVTDSTNGISFNTGSYHVNLTEGTINESSTGNLAFTGDNSSASSEEGNSLLSQTTDNNPLQSTPATKLADLTFSYTVVSQDNPNVFMDITYTIPLYTYYDSSTQTAYVYYNNSEVSTKGATAITHDGYKYGITGVGLFVDDRALVSLPGAEGDTNLYTGWAINTDTMKNNYSEYVVGEDNSEYYLGAKDNAGEFNITGIFSITNTAVTPPPAPTPEPATMLLTGLGLAGMGFMKRRGKKA